jgi:hypothetical protein
LAVLERCRAPRIPSQFEAGGREDLPNRTFEIGIIQATCPRWRGELEAAVLPSPKPALGPQDMGKVMAVPAVVAAAPTWARCPDWSRRTVQ